MNGYLIAKTKNGESVYLPLNYHGADAACVIARLIDHFESFHVINISGLSKEDFKKIAMFVAYVHDIGKATILFLLSVKGCLTPDIIRLVEETGVSIFGVHCLKQKFHHAYLGDQILTSRHINIKVSDSIAAVVGAHHGVFYRSLNDNITETYKSLFFGLTDEKGNINKDVLSKIWNKLIQDAMVFSGVSEDLLQTNLSSRNQILLSGLLVKADWIASDESLYPLIDKDKRLTPQEISDRTENAFNKLQLPERWDSSIFEMTDSVFESRFGFKPNDIQKQFFQVVNNVKETGVYILEAPMGIGKTEAALAAASILAAQFGANGLYYGLPTKATSNAMFERILPWAEKESEEALLSIRLAHGSAFLNEEYENLLNTAHQEDTGLIAHKWFDTGKKAAMANFMVGTIDSLLACSLQAKHFNLRHLGFAGKILISDETHAYDTYTSSFLEETLKWAGYYEIPVILLSATLTTSKRESLIKSYTNAYAKVNRIKGGKTTKLSSNEYPLLTWSDGADVFQKPLHYKHEKKCIRVMRKRDKDAVVETVCEVLKAGGCAEIIANTVRSAEEIYDRISSRKEVRKAILYHSYTLGIDRIKKERDILASIGKKSTQNDRSGVVIIGTQVLEQSLDTDADFMVTQLCPIDLMFQRVGRLHRHKRDDRPESLREPVLMIWEDDVGLRYHTSMSVYGSYLRDIDRQCQCEELLEKTDRVIKDRLVIPDDIPAMIDLVYNSDNDLGITSPEFIKAKQYRAIAKQAEMHKAKEYMISPPLSKFRNNVRDLAINADFGNAAIARTVRDIVPSVEVILLKSLSETEAVTVSSKEHPLVIPKGEVPNNDAARELLKEKIRLPLSVVSDLARTIHRLEELRSKTVPLWANSKWLRNELFLFLGEDGTAELNGYKISYTYEKGLLWERKKHPTQL